MFAILFLSAISFTTDFKRFFFLSEAVWLALLVGLLGSNLILGNPIIITTSFFVLVFTACEAVILAAILLLGSESKHNDAYLKSDTL